jgi:hypothetical protein
MNLHRKNHNLKQFVVRTKGMSLRRAIKRRNVVVIDNLATKQLEVRTITHKNKSGQRYRFSNQAIKPFAIGYTIKELHDMTVSTFEHIFADKQVCKYLASTVLGPLAPITKPKELAIIE